MHPDQAADCCRKEKKRKEKKRKENKTKQKKTPFGVDLMKSQVLYRADCCMYVSTHSDSEHTCCVLP